MVIKTKFPYPLFLWFFFTIYFSSGLLSLGHGISRQRTDLGRCVDQCRREEKDFPGLFDCAARCDRKYAGTTPWEGEGSRRELQKCQKRCESEESGRTQQQQCEQRCVEEVREEEQERQREQIEREREKREKEQRERQEREEGDQEQEREREGGEQQREREREQKREREREQQREREKEQTRKRERERREEEGEERERREEEKEEEQEEIERQREREREERERDREREREVSRHDYSSRDPEEKFEQCMQLCKKQPVRQELQCKKRCKRQYEGTKRNLQQEEISQLLRGNGGAGEENYHGSHQPYEQCRKQCERQERGEQHQQQCKSWCEQQREKEDKRRKGEQNPQREEQQQRNNPYYFHAQRFHYLFKSQEGHIKVLQRFSERSQLLRGIDNYRLVITEANPSTLVVPHHSDAETIAVVVRGKGIITLVSQERRESFNMGLGDMLRVPAGVTKYFAAGGGNPESYYRVFSNDILQRALNTPSDQLQRLFEGEQRQHGAIRRATPEQLKALSQHATPKKSSSESGSPFNLLSKEPLYHNNF
ncbi:vicilin-like antimicrobial peptides 2-1 [Pistacia vera]|uniref:vicilin-like antimicrobial peptides 2-1 n=1 Tax=Pistacia vera TaxID=55513 RepID=UPI001262E189|nr:vicilin-like antimicrobial peptides 2-1 [Pistacia vera]